MAGSVSSSRINKSIMRSIGFRMSSVSKVASHGRATGAQHLEALSGRCLYLLFSSRFCHFGRVVTRTQLAMPMPVPPAP